MNNEISSKSSGRKRKSDKPENPTTPLENLVGEENKLEEVDKTSETSEALDREDSNVGDNHLPVKKRKSSLQSGTSESKDEPSCSKAGESAPKTREYDPDLHEIALTLLEMHKTPYFYQPSTSKIAEENKDLNQSAPNEPKENSSLNDFFVLEAKEIELQNLILDFLEHHPLVGQSLEYKNKRFDLKSWQMYFPELQKYFNQDVLPQTERIPQPSTSSNLNSRSKKHKSKRHKSSRKSEHKSRSKTRGEKRAFDEDSPKEIRSKKRSKQEKYYGAESASKSSKKSKKSKRQDKKSKKHEKYSTLKPDFSKSKRGRSCVNEKPQTSHEKRSKSESNIKKIQNDEEVKNLKNRFVIKKKNNESEANQILPQVETEMEIEEVGVEIEAEIETENKTKNETDPSIFNEIKSEMYNEEEEIPMNKETLNQEVDEDSDVIMVEVPNSDKNEKMNKNYKNLEHPMQYLSLKLPNFNDPDRVSRRFINVGNGAIGLLETCYEFFVNTPMILHPGCLYATPFLYSASRPSTFESLFCPYRFKFSPEVVNHHFIVLNDTHSQNNFNEHSTPPQPTYQNNHGGEEYIDVDDTGNEEEIINVEDIIDDDEIINLEENSNEEENITMDDSLNIFDPYEWKFMQDYQDDYIPDENLYPNVEEPVPSTSGINQNNHFDYNEPIYISSDDEDTPYYTIKVKPTSSLQ
ncbi:micronuclear linker histone polyprotein-like [Onthophagus taurus]|uniref:micronuclear linker histone polyprotein-like n=1 Tax=Onthophagus taurus TaxID=166361 RepID=UPI0039BDAC96